MPDKSRVWIYQADRKLSDSETDDITKSLQNFCESWAAHNKELETSFKIEKPLFIILSVNESKTSASGCSIDSSLKEINAIEKKHNISFLNRHLLAFNLDDEIELIDLGQIPEDIKSKKINIDSIFFNNLATSKEELSSQWMVPVGTTWLKKYF